MNEKQNSLVLVTGAFDIVHIGHIRMLEYARSLTNRGVIVMIDDDDRIKNTKGITRPFNSLRDRREFLLALNSVDWVLTIHSDSDIIDTCKQINPVRVVGGDWKGKMIVGGDFCSEIKYFDRIPGYSTTKILAEDNSDDFDKNLENIKEKQNLPQTPLIPLHSIFRTLKKFLKRNDDSEE